MYSHYYCAEFMKYRSNWLSLPSCLRVSNNQNQQTKGTNPLQYILAGFWLALLLPKT